MKAILLAVLWILAVFGSSIGFVVAGFWAFETGHYFLGSLVVIGWMFFGAIYATTERFTKWPPAVD